MDQITRSPEPPQQRMESSNAPRGEELQQASNLFAELLAKQGKNSKIPDSQVEESKTDEFGDGESVDVEGGSTQTGALPYGIHLPGERGQGSQHQGSQHQGFQHQGSQQDQSQKRFVEVVEISGTENKPPADSLTTRIEQPEIPRFLGPPKRVIDADPKFESLIQSEAPPREISSATQPLPTPGELMLQAFSATRIEAPTPTRIEHTTFTRIDAIRELGEQIAERILVTRPESAGPQEMLIQLKDSALAGTEVRMSHNGERLEITLVTDNASSFHLLAARQTDLQSKLGDGVVVQLSFDPDGMISQQRMERPIAADSGQQAGDRNRERGSSDERRRDQRRDQQQDRDS